MISKQQPGFQVRFCGSTATICLATGGAGGGKTDALLRDAAALTHYDCYSAVIFRKLLTSSKGAGALWSDAKRMWAPWGATFLDSETLARWGRSTIQLSYLSTESDVRGWDGRELDWIGFEELTEIPELAFWALFARLRSTTGAPRKFRGTANPSSTSWLRALLVGAGYIDNETGDPIPEMDGKVRWFVRDTKDQLHWFDCEADARVRYPEEQPESFQHFTSTLEDNQILIERDPGYLARLGKLSLKDRLRLRDGNWNAPPSPGAVFNRAWFRYLDEIDPNLIRFSVRAWDLAATAPTKANPDPDWTRGVLVHALKDGNLCIGDIVSARSEPGPVNALLLTTARTDGPGVTQAFYMDPASAGKRDREAVERLLKPEGCKVSFLPATKDKITNAKPFAAFCAPDTNPGRGELGRVAILRRPWLSELLNELELFPTKGIHDDQVDALSRAYAEIASQGADFQRRFMTAMSHVGKSRDFSPWIAH